MDPSVFACAPLSVRRWGKADPADRGADAAVTAARPVPAIHRRVRSAWRARSDLPGLLRIRPGLTPLAAAGLVIIMVGAVWVNLTYAEATLALIPLVVGILAAFVAYSRWRVAPLH